MIRSVFSTLFLLLMAVLAASYVLYGEVEPCKALAAEKWQRAQAGAGIVQQIGQQVGLENEMTYRAQTSQLPTGACLTDLLSSWQERWDGGRQPAN